MSGQPVRSPRRSTPIRRRPKLPRPFWALALVALAIGAAVVVADLGSDSRIDEEPPAGPTDLVVDEPEGEPRGLVWILCCGGWKSPQSVGLDLELRRDRFALGVGDWLARDYVVATFGFRGPRTSVEDAVATFDRLRQDHPGLGICALGASAAGHAALMVAAERPALDCVVAQGSPSVLSELPAGDPGDLLPEAPLELARRAFGSKERLDELSPLFRADEIAASVEMSACSDDLIVPASQARRMGAALERNPRRGRIVETPILRGVTPTPREGPPRGWREFIHSCFVPRGSSDRYVSDTFRFVERALPEPSRSPDSGS